MRGQRDSTLIHQTSLRKQPTFLDATAAFLPRKMLLKCQTRCGVEKSGLFSQAIIKPEN